MRDTCFVIAIVCITYHETRPFDILFSYDVSNDIVRAPPHINKGVYDDNARVCDWK